MASPELPPLLLSLAGLLGIAADYARSRERSRALADQINSGDTSSTARPGNALTQVAGRIVPPRLVRADGLRLVRAGINMPPETLWVYRAAAAAFGSVVLPVLGMALGLAGTGVLVSVGGAAGLLTIEWLLAWRARRRLALLRRDWPGFLHRLRLCLLAGMPLAAALEAVGSLGTGKPSPVDGDLATVVRKVRAGLPCESALTEWAEASGSGEVAVLANAAERSRMTGVPLAATVEFHHRSARARHRLAYMTWLNALPSRLSTVAMIFFLPAVLIVVLMPNVIAFLRSGW